MLEFNAEPVKIIKVGSKPISVFDIGDNNVDKETVESFGIEWTKFSDFTDDDLITVGNEYFDIVPEDVYAGKEILDLGCGTGRWSKYLSKRASCIEAVDPSVAVFSAASVLKDCENVRVSQASIDQLPFDDNSFDFVFGLGVLHHIPDTQSAMNECVRKVKPGGYFLVYLYYSLDNRGLFFKTLFYISNAMRKIISKQRPFLKGLLCDLLAILIYIPFVSVSKLLRLLGLKHLIKYIPLSYYSNKSINIIRNDSLDRFGTPLEQRFSKKEIEDMMRSAGLGEIIFSDAAPYWHAIGKKV